MNDVTKRRGDDGQKKRRRKKQKQQRRAERRLPFAAAYPAHEGLDQLLVAFEAGNYAYVRREAPRLIEATSDDEVREAARDLRRRIDPEPTAAFLWALGVALVVMLYAFYLGR